MKYRWILFLALIGLGAIECSDMLGAGNYLNNTLQDKDNLPVSVTATPSPHSSKKAQQKNSRTYVKKTKYCNKCSFSHTETCEFNSHIETHIQRSTKPFHCLLCHAWYSNKSGLMSHNRTKWHITAMVKYEQNLNQKLADNKAENNDEYDGQEYNLDTAYDLSSADQTLAIDTQPKSMRSTPTTQPNQFSSSEDTTSTNIKEMSDQELLSLIEPMSNEELVQLMIETYGKTDTQPNPFSDVVDQTTTINKSS